MTEPAIEQFERAYAGRSGVTVDFLHQHGRFGAPCDCDEPDCEGFQMMHLRDKLVDAGWTPPPEAERPVLSFDARQDDVMPFWWEALG